MKWLLFVFILLLQAFSDSGFAQTFSDSLKANDSSNLIEVGDITIIGNKKTKDYIIIRELTFSKGNHMLLDELNSKMQESANNLKSASLFVQVDVKIIDRIGNKVFVLIEVKERWYLFPLPYFKLVDRNFNEWWVQNNRSLDRINYGLKFLYFNVSGRRDNLAVNLISGYSKQIMFRYDQPYADKSLKHGFGVFFNYTSQKEIAINALNNKVVFYKSDNFIKETYRGEISYYYRPAIKSSHSLHLGYITENFGDSVSKINPKFSKGVNQFNYPELSYNFIYNDVDYVPYPSKGIQIKAGFTKRGITEQMNLWRFKTQVTYTKPVFQKSELQFQFGGIINLPFDQPYYNSELFYKEFYLRGLEYFVVDGNAGLIGRATARKQVLNFTLNNPIKIKSLEKIPFRFVLKAYGDLGYAFANKQNFNQSMLNNKWLKTWGVGLDLITFYDIVLRFEYSFNQFNNQGLFLHSKSDF